MLNPTESQTKAVAFCCSRCGGHVEIGEVDPDLGEVFARLCRYVLCSKCHLEDTERTPRGYRNAAAIPTAMAQPSHQREIRSPYRDD